MRPETAETQERPAISGAQYIFIRPSVSITHCPALGLEPGCIVDTVEFSSGPIAGTAAKLKGRL